MLFLAERVNIMEFNETMKINLEFDKEKEVREIVAKVYEALKIKGYDPISQIVGYILSGDPTYITSYNGARGLIVKIERDELLEEFIHTFYLYAKNPSNDGFFSFITIFSLIPALHPHHHLTVRCILQLF